MKRYISLILSASIVLGIVPLFGASGFAAESGAAENTTFEFTDIAVNLGVDRTQMNFTWYQNSDAESVIYVAKASELVNGEMPENAMCVTAVSTVNAEGLYSNKATVTGLDYSTEYAYQIVTGDNRTEVYTFTTGAKKEFSFVFAGDPQIGSSGNTARDTETWNDTLKLIDENEIFSDVSFLLSAGDHVESYSNETQYGGYLNQTYLTELPSVNVIGNHDASGANFGEHFNLPGESADTNTSSAAGNNYYFMYNDVLFMVLNANRTNYAYHKAFINEVIEAHPEAEWKVVTMHQSVFGVAYHANQSSSIDMRNGFIPVFEECDIDVVLMGHDHVYCRTFLMDGLNPITDVSAYDNATYTSTTDPDGILYVTANSGSGSKYYDFAFAGSIFPFVAVQNQEHVPNVSKVYFSDTEFSITTYRTNDMSVVDTFTINRTPDEDDEVEELIEAIGEVTLDSEDDIAAARDAYDALPEDAQIKVYNSDDLTAAEAELAKLKADTAAAVTLNIENAPKTAEAETEFTVDITASTARSEAQKLNALNFALTYDSTKLELVGITANTAIGGEAVTNGAAFGWNGGADGLSVTADSALIATATFKVKSGITNGDTACVGIGDNDDTKLIAKLVGEADIFVPGICESDEITLYLDIFEFWFISAEQYKALDPDTKILAIEAVANDTTYSLGGYNFYYSSKYGAYVAIVGSGITEDGVRAMVTSADGADVDVIAYNGDVTGESGNTAGDAAMVSEMLHAPDGEYTDLMRFEADVYGTYTEGSAYVTCADAMWILYASVGLEYGN